METPPNRDKGNAPSRPHHHRRVASNAVHQQSLAAMIHGIASEQQPGPRTTFNHGALEFRPAPAHRGGNGVGPPTGPYTPPYPAGGGLPSTARTFAPTDANPSPLQLFNAGAKYPPSGPYSATGYPQGNMGVYGGYGIPGFPQGYAGGGHMVGHGSNATGNLVPPPGLAQVTHGVVKQAFGPPQGPAQATHGVMKQAFGPPQGPAQSGVVVQSGVIRGGRPQTQFNGPVQKLSYECQARKFNPEVSDPFHVPDWRLALVCALLTTVILKFRVNVQDDMYTCDIILKNRLIQGTKRSDDPQSAKLHTAAKALKEIKLWPLPGPLSDSLADKLQKPLDDQQESKSSKEEEETDGDVLFMAPPGPGPASGVDMSDPVQAHAFVEGYRMGYATHLRGSSTEVQVDDIKQIVKQQPKSSRRRSRRSPRSRSPRRGHREDRRRRSRSPPRYFDGSRHDPKLPSTDKYRPTPAPAYRNADKPKKEDSYGRLKEEDYAE